MALERGCRKGAEEGEAAAQLDIICAELHSALDALRRATVVVRAVTAWRDLLFVLTRRRKEEV